MDAQTLVRALLKVDPRRPEVLLMDIWNDEKDDISRWHEMMTWHEFLFVVYPIEKMNKDLEVLMNLEFAAAFESLIWPCSACVILQKAPFEARENVSEMTMTCGIMWNDELHLAQVYRMYRI